MLGAASSAGYGQEQTQPGDPIPVSLTSYFNNDGIGSSPGEADFASSYAYPAAELPTAGIINAGDVPYLFPDSQGQDNVVALGQTISLPEHRYVSAYLLTASSYGPASGTAVVHYADGSTSTAPVTSPDWYTGSGVVTAPYRYTPSGVDQHPVSMYVQEVWLDPERNATSLTLPTTAPADSAKASMHIFALTLQPAVPGYAVRISSDARSTTKTMSLGDGKSGAAQIVEATVQNVGSKWLTDRDDATVTVEAQGVHTVAPASITALAPGEQARVEVGIQKADSIPDGSQLPGKVVAVLPDGQSTAQDLTLTAGIPAWQPTNTSLSQHESPDWFNNAKFGIFINWGLYSVPAWAPVGGVYAEWYWYSMNQKGSPTYQHQLDTYGPDSTYDDFIKQFTASKFDPDQWMQLIKQSGARYFVFDAKHHDGYALFDDKSNGRNSVNLTPHRDLLGELMTAAKRDAPNIKRGIYFSLPEWYNPDYPGYSSWPGGGAKQYVTNAPIPYTGYHRVNNYVNDYQKPQMMELVDNYDPDIFWCDIGGPNDSQDVFAHWFNETMLRPDPKQVAVNDRCGIPSHDFTTPEYTQYGSTVVEKWESNRGLDPHSYGYNSATPDDAYMTADQAVDDLIDIVSKNGNLLLNIGPEADGTIPAIMQARLRQIGNWLRVNGEAIYNTTYWARMGAVGDLRFTVRQNKAFYITSLDQPGDQLVVDAPVPIRANDKVTMLGYGGQPLHWTKSGGKLIIDVPQAARNAGQYAWVFKISWQQ